MQDIGNLVTNKINFPTELLLGALLTFLTLYVIDILKSGAEKRDKTKNFKLYIKLELEVIAKTLDKLQTALEYANYYDFTLLDRVKESVDSLEKSRNDVIFLSDPSLKEKFIDLISDVSTYVAMVRVGQQIYYNQQNEANNPKLTKIKKNKNNPVEPPLETFNKFRTQKSIQYVEIKRRLEELIKGIRI